MKGLNAHRKEELLQWAMDPQNDGLTMPGASAREELILTQLRRIRIGLSFPSAHASQEAIGRAKSIFIAPERRTILAQLLSPRPSFGFARGLAAEVFYLGFQAEERVVQISFGRLPTGWQVLGRVDEAGWTARCGSQEETCTDDGRFEFQVADLDDCSILLTRQEVTILIPSPEDLRRHDGE